MPSGLRSASSTCGAPVTRCATLLVKEQIEATPLESAERCAGDDVTFSTEASGTGPFRYEWTKDGQAPAISTFATKAAE